MSPEELAAIFLAKNVPGRRYRPISENAEQCDALWFSSLSHNWPTKKESPELPPNNQFMGYTKGAGGACPTWKLIGPCGFAQFGLQTH